MTPERLAHLRNTCNHGVLSTQEACEMLAELERLRADCETMVLRLLGESYETFSPETMEVMDRWGPIVCEKHNIFRSAD